MKVAQFAVLSVTAAAVLASCSNVAAGVPNVVGTWTGSYSFALANGTANPSTETLIITRQDGRLLWGYEQWEEAGTQMRADLTGTLTNDGSRIVLTEPAGFYDGTVEDNTMTVTFIRTDPDQHTAFEVQLTRR